MTITPCPCGSGLAYTGCCQPWHAGADAPTAEALMRSRYSAFARRDAAHLIRTSDAATRMRLRPGDFRAAFALTWTGLEIVATAAGRRDDQEGVVRFRAHYRGPAGSGVLDETSRFHREGGAWVYRDGRGRLP